MSQLTSSNDKTPVIEDRSATDIFKGLNEGDELDSLDLTTPIPIKKKAEEKPKEDEKVDKLAKPEEDEEETEPEEEEEIDELAELEEELEDPKEEDLELIAPIRRREILAKYPEFFKDFPPVEKAIYREREYTKLLPTIADAKSAVEKVQILDNFADDMISKGNVGNVLKMIKENSPETFDQVADNYLEHLAVVDERAYHHVVGNVIKNVIIGMVKEAKSSKDDDFRVAAALLNKYVFGSSEFVPIQKLAKESNGDKDKEDSVTKREQEFNERQLKTATNEIDTRVKNTVKSYIDKNIDPKGSMTDYVKRTAARDAVDKINSLIEKDSRFVALHEKLVEGMIKANFSQESQDKVKRAYLAKAKSLMTPVLKSVRNEALRGMGKRVKNEDIEEVIEGKDEKDEKKPERQRTEQRSSSNKNQTKLDSLKGKSSYEALNALMGDR